MSCKDGKTVFSIARRHPIVVFLGLAFLISWGGVLMICLPTGIPGSGAALDTLLAPVYLAMLSGPFLSALILSAILGDKTEFTRLFHGFAVWRAKPVEYAAAFLLIPACALTVLFALSLISPDFKPGFLMMEDGFSVVIMSIATGLAGGFAVAVIEETGWTGFATPRLLSRYSVMTTGIGFGLIHGFWHFLVTVWLVGGEYGLMVIPFLLTLWLLALVVMRILIVWIYARTGSTFLAAIVHASHTGTLFAIWPPATNPAQDVIWTGAFAILGLIAVLTISYASRNRRTH